MSDPDTPTHEDERMSNETFTELDIDERRQLRDEVEAIESGQRIRLTYDSRRSHNDQTVEVRTKTHEEVALYGYTDDLKGDIYVKIRDDLTKKHHAGLIVRTTGGRTTSRQPQLGELLSVEVIDDGG